MDEISLIDNDTIPEEIKQEQNKNENKQQGAKGKVLLFFSFDIVNSTAYKMMTEHWSLIIKELLKTVQRGVIKSDALERSSLWRVIGDEVVFVLPVQSEESIENAIEAIFRLLMRLTTSIKTGKFFETLSSQCISKEQINLLKMQNVLMLKAAAWVAAVSEQGIYSNYDNIEVRYQIDEKNKFIVDYLGKDMDAGFRVKALAQSRQLIVSFELAKIIHEVTIRKNLQNTLYIMGYEKLKGVWNGSLYPIIWYYNESIVSESNGTNNRTPNQLTIRSFKNSFLYNEYESNKYIKSYLSRNRILKENGSYPFHNSPIDMYNVEVALSKIETDQGLRWKFESLKSLFKDGESFTVNKENSESSLELHCTVVCYDSESRSIMVLKRNQNHETNCGAWEFGCAKVMGDKSIAEEIKSYYRERYNVHIELIMDETRNEVQPYPIAIYEVKDKLNKKGLIFLARTHKPENEFRSDIAHSEVKWICKEDLPSITEPKIPDFDNTIKQAFKYFEEAEKKNAKK